MKARKKKSHETVWFHGSHSFAIGSDQAIRIFRINCLGSRLHFVKALRKT